MEQKLACNKGCQNQDPPDRPTAYSKQIGEEVCGRLVEDESLRSICADRAMPDRATIAAWLCNNQDFRDAYAHARQFQAHCITQDCIALADEIRPHWVETVRRGRVVMVPVRKNLARYRLRLAVRHFVADALFSHARQLSTCTLFPWLASGEFESLGDLVRDSSPIKKG